VRHIPEEELHAYLDQALSRSQCIEIETHLAVCYPCQGDRDAIAALRDRTTRLLGLAAPVRTHAPAWTELEGKAAVRRQQMPWRRLGVWAASIAGAVLAGWGLRTLSYPHPTPLALRPMAPAIFAVRPAPTPVRNIAVEPTADAGQFGSDEAVQLVGTRRPPAVVAPPPTPAVVSRSLTLTGEWSAVSLNEAEEMTGGLVARISELPVMQVQLQRAGDSRPLMLVTQTHASGERVYIVEGPVSQVAELISAQLGFSSSEPSRSLPDYVEAGGTVRRSNRVLAVFGRLPADSLNALAAGVVFK
jgi:Putative zinc-finger